MNKILSKKIYFSYNFFNGILICYKFLHIINNIINFLLLLDCYIWFSAKIILHCCGRKAWYFGYWHKMRSNTNVIFKIYYYH